MAVNLLVPGELLGHWVVIDRPSAATACTFVLEETLARKSKRYMKAIHLPRNRTTVMADELPSFLQCQLAYDIESTTD